MERAGTRAGESRYSCHVRLPGGKLTRRSSAEMGLHGGGWRVLNSDSYSFTATFKLLSNQFSFQNTIHIPVAEPWLWSLGLQRIRFHLRLQKPTCEQCAAGQWWRTSLNNWSYRRLLGASDGFQTKTLLVSWITQKFVSGLFFQNTQDTEKRNSPISVFYFISLSKKMNTMNSQ